MNYVEGLAVSLLMATILAIPLMFAVLGVAKSKEIEEDLRKKRGEEE